MKDNIKRRPMDYKKSGTTKMVKEPTKETKLFPDKAYDPYQLFRQRKTDNPKVNEMQRIENVVDQERTFPEKVTKDRFKQLKSFLKKQ